MSQNPEENESVNIQEVGLLITLHANAMKMKDRKTAGILSNKLQTARITDSDMTCLEYLREHKYRVIDGKQPYMALLNKFLASCDLLKCVISSILINNDHESVI